MPSVPGARTAEQIRDEARRQWSSDPAGALAAVDGTLDHPSAFAEVER